MRPFKCSTKDCSGTVASTNEGRRWVWGVLRIWLCSVCRRRYQVGDA